METIGETGMIAALVVERDSLVAEDLSEIVLGAVPGCALHVASDSQSALDLLEQEEVTPWAAFLHLSGKDRMSPVLLERLQRAGTQIVVIDELPGLPGMAAVEPADRISQPFASADVVAAIARLRARGTPGRPGTS